MAKQSVDEIAAHNRERWNDLVEAGIAYAQPWLDLTPSNALVRLDPDHVITDLLGDLRGKDVLCLAGGGGQQSVAFAVLGANVTVTDLSDRQLEQDRLAATHYGIQLNVLQTDMRDLSALSDAAFDLVFQPFSINFSPSIQPVIAEVARVLRPGGVYRVEWYNPFAQLMDPEQDWTGDGYLFRHPYRDGIEASALYPTWTVEQDGAPPKVVPSPHEFVHTLSTMVNTLAANHFVIRRAREHIADQTDVAPGSWEHSTSIAPPYLTFWSVYRPDLSYTYTDAQ